MEPPTRNVFTSSWGTVLATAGVAIGLGNIWRFPYMMGKHGGAIFLLTYLLIAIGFGLPGLMAELALARHTRRATLGAFERAGLPGGRIVGYLLILTVLMASSYYGVVVGWVLYFACDFGLAAVGASTHGDFTSLSASFSTQALCLLAVSLFGGATLYLGIHRGIERVSRFGLPLFFLLILVLVVRVLTLTGAWDELTEFLRPNWSAFTRTTPLAAMGQVFFSFGLGGTFMLAYGSYLRDEENIPRVAILTGAADITAALMAAMIVIPATLAFGLPLTSGPAMMFDVMPVVFTKMPGGDWFGAMFFGSVFIVALLSQMAAFEVVVRALVDGFGWSRASGVITAVAASTLLAVPAMLSVGYIEKSDFIWGSTMQPIGALFAIIAFAWYIDIGKALAELRRGTKLPVPTWLFYWIRIPVPIGIATTLVFTWLSR